MSEHEHELREAELLMCNICAQAFSTEEFLSAHLNDAHHIRTGFRVPSDEVGERSDASDV